MKKILYSLCLIFLPSFIFAQAGIPHIGLNRDTVLPCGQTCVDIAAQYLYTGSTDSYSVQQVPYLPLPYNTGTPILVNLDDTWSQIVPLPFKFCFFGTVYDSIIVGSNGVLSFNTASTGGFNSWAIPGPVPANTPSDLYASILGPHQDIDPTHLGNMYSEIAGVYPYRYYKISWDSIPYYGDPNSVSTNQSTTPLWSSSQIILYETTNMIDIYIRDKSVLATWNGGLAIEGIVSAGATAAYTVPGRNATQWTAQNDGWRFTPSGAGNIVRAQLLQGTTVIDSAYGDSTQVLVRHICPPSSPDSAVTTTYYAQVTYDLCSGGSVTLYDSLHVTVLPTAAIQSTQSICQGSTLTLSSCGGGSWSVLPGNPSALTISGATATGFDSLGTYLLLYCTASVCDTVAVSVHTQVSTSVYATICGSQTYTFYGATYMNAGVYVDTLLSATACDTIATLYLSVVSADTTQLTDTICAGATLAFGTQTLSSAGTYTNLLTSAGGCDSLIVLQLAVDTPQAAGIVSAGSMLIATPQGAPLYLWYINNGGTPVAVGDTFVPSIPGSYTVSVGSRAITCLSTSAPYVVISGINEIGTAQMKVYPNPGNGKFVIESTGMIGKEYTVSDILGQQIAGGSIHQGKEQLDLSRAVNGIYILIINGNAIKLTVSR